MTRRVGKIIRIASLNVWPHEQIMANQLANAGYTVEFIPPSTIKHKSTPDVLIDGEKWEMKAPRASNLKAIERNLKLGSWQSSKIVFTARRMKGMPDKAVQRELTKKLADLPQVTEIKFIDRHGNVIDIR